MSELWTPLYVALSFLLPATAPAADLAAPAKGKIQVAFVLAPHATVIDFTGPWEVFQDVHVEGRGSTHDEMMPFSLYTVAASREAVTATGGLKILPDFTFDDAPQPDVIVVPALKGSADLHRWLREAGGGADLVMSVCTGAFQLAKAGLLNGKRATTHHNFLDEFERQFPKVELVRDTRWVENEGISTAAGLTSGIDLALRVVGRYFGEAVAKQTADYMEHSSDGWREHGGTRIAELGG